MWYRRWWDIISQVYEYMTLISGCISVLMEVSWTQLKIIIIIYSVLYLTNVIHIGVILYTDYCTLLIFWVK